MRVILISGKARNGKDCFASYLERELKQRGLRTLNIHYADFLKFFCQKYLGWSGNKDIEGRRILQETGQGFRSSYKDAWCDIMEGFLKGAAQFYDWVLIPDVRYENEILMPKELYQDGWIEQLEIIRVERPNYENDLTEEQRRHESETALDDYPFPSYYLNVGGLDTMEANAKEWVDAILSK